MISAGNNVIIPKGQIDEEETKCWYLRDKGGGGEFLMCECWSDAKLELDSIIS